MVCVTSKATKEGRVWWRIAWKAYGILGNIVAESLLSMAKMFPIFLLFGNTADFGEANFVSATMLLEVSQTGRN